MNEKNFKIVADAAELNQAAAELLVKTAAAAISERGVFSMALSGGSTPKKLYELLASESFREQIDWTKTHFFFGDERNVPPDHNESNFKMVNEIMFSRIGELPQENVHRVLAENPAADAASDYEQTLKDFFNNELPRFDLVLLGMGADGHTASLFPESSALEENVRFFAENWVEKFGAYRLTLTFPVINNANNILFLIAGVDKAKVLGEVFHGSLKKYPAQMINPTDGKLIWLIDEAAASEIE